MNERELLRRALTVYGLDKEAIRQEARRRGAARLRKGDLPMKRNKWTIAAATVAACLCLCGGVYAAGYWLKASQVAEAAGRPDLAALFEGENAVPVEQTQTDDGYTVTLLGLTSGDRLGSYWSSYWTEEAPLTGRTYAVLAVQGQAGSDPDADFAYENSAVLPVIHTTELSPWQYWLNPERQDLTVDGVRYLLIGCDELEPFAGQGVSLCLSTGGIGWNAAAFTYDAATGTVAANPDYAGVNLVFDLPLDESLADPDKAQAFIEQWKNGGTDTSAADSGTDLAAAVAEAAAKAAGMTPDEVRTAGILQSTQTVACTENAGYSGGKCWQLPDGSTLALDAITEGETQVMTLWLVDDTADQATLVTRNPDDTLTVEVYSLTTS